MSWNTDLNEMPIEEIVFLTLERIDHSRHVILGEVSIVRGERRYFDDNGNPVDFPYYRPGTKVVAWMPYPKPHQA